MSFECRKCDREVSNSEMLGLAIGQCTKSAIEKKLGAGFSKEDFTTGFLNGLKVHCPSCGKADWKNK